MSHACGQCGSDGARLRCSGCTAEDAVYYCSKEHQKKHWKVHKKQCKFARDKATKQAWTSPAPAPSSSSSSSSSSTCTSSAAAAASATASSGVSSLGGAALRAEAAAAAAEDPGLVAAAANEAKYDKRKKVEYDGRVVYEWEQELDELLLYITPPPGAKAEHFDVKITATHLTLGLKGSPPYLDEDLGGLCDVDASMWYMEDGVLIINLQKARPGETWLAACVGRGSLDSVEAQQVQQQLMLQRFQREHPGFDFSQAQFNGAAPDPRTFLGGIDRTKLQ